MSNADRFDCFDELLSYGMSQSGAREDDELVMQCRALLRELRENAVPPSPAPCPEPREAEPAGWAVVDNEGGVEEIFISGPEKAHEYINEKITECDEAEQATDDLIKLLAQYTVRPVFLHPSPAPSPEGWQLVPKEPTKEMIAEATSSSRNGFNEYEDYYAAMLAAAPSAQGVEGKT